MADFHVLFRVRENKPTEDPHIDSIEPELSEVLQLILISMFIFLGSPLPFKCTAIDSGYRLIFLTCFFFSLILEIQKLIALCLYHLPRSMRIYHIIKPYFNVFRFLCKIHTNWASSENLCCSSILRFSMSSFSVAESSS